MLRCRLVWFCWGDERAVVKPRGLVKSARTSTNGCDGVFAGRKLNEKTARMTSGKLPIRAGRFA